MRALLAALALAALACQPARADQPAAAADRAAIERVIRGQIGAFQRDDAPGAFAYAAPGTQERFGDASAFLDLVRRAYQPVYHPRAIDFTSLATEDGALVQSVELIGPDGAAYTARYTMEREADGSWRIVACELLASQRLGA